jgi:teichoic acid transport system permease protein
MKTLISNLKDHVKWRHQIFQLAKSDIIKTYSGSALGWAWAVVKPTVTIAVLWFVIGIGLRQGGDIEGYPFLLWLITGLVPWFYMDDMITESTTAFLTYSFLITKMKFPISTIPTFVGVAKLIIHLALTLVVVLFYAGYGYYPDIYILQLPIYMFLMFLFFINWGLFAAMLSAISKDFMNLVKAFVTAIFWLSGILFNVRTDEMPQWVRSIETVNPVSFIVEGYRDVFVYKVWFWENPKKMTYFFLVLIIMGALATWSYRKLYREIPDIL